MRTPVTTLAATLLLLAPLVPATADDAPGALLTPNDPRYADQPGLVQVGAPAAWDITTGDLDARVCVVDTGLRATHEEFTGRVVGWTDLIGGSGEAYDDHGHGTMFAGIAAARLNNGLGIAGVGNVGILAAKALSSSGSGTFENVASAILWCSQTGGPRTVIALPLGSSTSNALVEAAILQATSDGALVVASAGSSGSVAFPARMPEVVAVACSTSTETACSTAPRGPELDVLAPGVSSWTTGHEADDDYRASTGSSWSTALVSGAIALAWSHHPTLTSAQMHARVLATAQDLGVPGRDDTHGCGEIDFPTLLAGPPAGATCGVSLLSPPRALSASTGPAAGEISLAWIAPLSDGGSPVTTYRVERATTCDGPFTLLAEVDGAALTFRDADLGDGTTRCYRVRAVTALAESTPSNVASATTYSIPEPPVAIRAQPGIEAGSARVRWTLASTGGHATSIVVERRVDAGAFEEIARLPRMGGYDDEELSPLSWYSYRVRAANPAGESEPSPVACTRAAPWNADARLDPLECAIADAWAIDAP